MKPLSLLFALLLVTGLLFVAWEVAGQEEKAPDPDELVRKLLPDGWGAERERWANLGRCLPGIHSYFCELEGMGGTPYRRILMSSDGRELAVQDGGGFGDAAAQKEARVGFRDGKPLPDGCPAGWMGVLAVVSRTPEARARDPGSALTTAVLLAQLLTVKGRFVSASVKPADASGLRVEVEWAQGSPTWSYEETAAFAARFDRDGALAEFAKTQRSYAKHGRR